MTLTEGQQALRFLGELTGAGILVWAVSWTIRKVRKVNWHLSYLLSVAFFFIVGILIGTFITTPEHGARYAALYLVSGLLFWMVAAGYKWIVKRIAS
jgi:hypothetical protein